MSQRELHGAGCDIIQKSSIVRDKQYCAVVALEILLQPLDTLNIEVVGRLIQKENGWATQQELRQLNTHTPAARKFRCGTVEVGALETQAQQGLFNIRLAGVTTQNMVVILRIV